MPSNYKIGALIPMRVASERLPGKAIKILKDKPVVCHLLDRVFASKYLQKKNVVVCTTKDSSDEPLVEIVEQYGAMVYRGDTNDIIKRFNDAINFFGFDAVIQIDGDDIVADPEYMDLTMSALLKNSKLDVVSCAGLPLGIGTMSFTRKAMEKVFQQYRTKKNDTGFSSYFKETDFCKHQRVKPKNTHHIFNNVRLTLDYQEDFDFFEAIFSAIYKSQEIFYLSDIIHLLKNKPQLIKINNFLQDGYISRWNKKRSFQYIGLDGEIKKI